MSNPHFDVIVIGAGITGLGAGYHLATQRLSYVILEAGSDVGGVWATHRWHGARCDSEIIKYSFSFKPYLSRNCLQGSERIHAYLREVSDEFGLREHIRFGTRVLRATFDASRACWTVHTTNGTFTGQFLLNGNGYFAEPHIPRFPDTERFRGEIMHSAHLESGRTFHDKDVVVVGSGSTAICCAPALAKVARSVRLLQRSPSYIYEISNVVGPVTRLCQTLYRLGFHVPLRVLRYGLQCKDDVVFVVFRRFPGFARWFFKRHWRHAVGEETLCRHFSPRYNPWEQRIPVAIGLKACLERKEITISTGEIERFTADGIVLKSGERIHCDVCVLATGYDLELLKFELYVGEQPVHMGEVNCYRRLMLGGVPNYFHPLGVWHSAWTQSSEILTRHALRVIRHMRCYGFRTVSVDREQVDEKLGITPSYVLRCRARLPKFHGTLELPSIDNLVSFRFDPAAFRFS